MDTPEDTKAETKQEEKEVHPTILYIESVCKRASEEGFKLQLASNGFVWQDKTGQLFGQEWHLPTVQLLLLEACIALEAKQGWKILG